SFLILLIVISSGGAQVAEEGVPTTLITNIPPFDESAEFSRTNSRDMWENNSEKHPGEPSDSAKALKTIRSEKMSKQN
ncbi:MAG: hypothetical protein ACO3FE_14050, partial [Planctomycetaceae bacterium]